MGKTTLFLKYILPLLVKNGFKIIIYDYHHTYVERTPSLYKYVKKYIHELRGDGLEILQTINDEDTLSLLCERVMTFDHVVVVFEELHNYCNNASAPKSFLYLCRNCNNRYIGYIAIFQRPSEVPNAVTANAHHYFITYFSYPTEKERKYVLTPELLPYFSPSNPDQLKPFEFIYRSKGEYKWYKGKI
ncbi:MAG: hypothetical protein QXM92_01800 [Candidatus Anstonellales archaeon]